MARIKYLKHHFGIQPNTVVDEHRSEVVARLTKVETVYDPETKQHKQIKPIAVLTDEPTTADLERANVAKKPAEEKPKPAAATKKE